MQSTAAAKPFRLLFVLLTAAVVAGGCGALDLGSSDEPALRSVALESFAPDDTAGTGSVDPDSTATTPATTDDPEPQADPADGGAPAPGSSDPDPALSPDPDAVYPADTCYVQPVASELARQVGCDEPHSIEVYLSAELPGGPGAPYQGLDAAFEICGAEFRSLTGIGLNLATVFDRSVLRPSEKTWAQGERVVTCYVVYPEQTAARLATIDPVRSFGRVSVFGLEAGDCLVDFEESASWFEVTTCDQPHEAEVFVADRQPESGFPGQAELDARADELCFGQAFEDFVGRDYASSSVFSIVSVPTAETWDQGDRLINCILTDDLVRSRSLEGSEL